MQRLQLSLQYISLSDVHIWIVCSNILTSAFIKPSMAKMFLKKKSCWTTIVRILGLIGEGTYVFAANMKLVHNRFSWLSLDWVIQSTNPKGKSEVSVMAGLQKSSMWKGQSHHGRGCFCKYLYSMLLVYGNNKAVFVLVSFFVFGLIFVFVFDVKPPLVYKHTSVHTQWPRLS